MFALSLSANNPSTQDMMRNIVKSVIRRYGTDRIRYAVILFGNTVVDEFDFDSTLPDQKSILDAVDKLKKVDDSSNPNLQAAMDRSRQLFVSGPQREGVVKRVLVVLIDKTPSSSEQSLQTSRRNLQNELVTIIPVPIGSKVDMDRLHSSTVFKDHMTPVKTSDNPSEAAEEIMYKIPGMYLQLS